MQILYIGVWRNESKPAVELVHETYLNNFNYFKKKEMPGFLQTWADSAAGQTRPGDRNTILPKQGEFGEGWALHSYGRTEGVCAIAITDEEYDKRVAHGFLGKVIDEFLTRYTRPVLQNANKNTLQLPTLKADLVKYQNPAEADNIIKIQKELDDTKIALHHSIEAMLERGQKIDDMVAKSEYLSASSKMFYTQAKKQNSCCTVM